MIGAPSCDGWRARCRALRARALATRRGGRSMRSATSLSQPRRRRSSTAVAAIARCASWASVSASMVVLSTAAKP